MKEEIKNIYKKTILENNKSPFHFYKNENGAEIVKAYNPICGDRFEIFLEIGGGKIKEASFHGYGCAISKASTSILCKNLLGLPIGSALSLINEFEQVVDQSTISKNDDLNAFAAVKEFPGREECATLAWTSIKQYLQNQDGEPSSK